MFLIRRKVDGKFFKNKTYCEWYDKEKNWSFKISECSPFKSISGAKNSRGWSGTKIVKTARACPECISAPIDKPNYVHFYGDNNRKPCLKRVPMTAEECPYEIVKVVLTLQFC